MVIIPSRSLVRTSRGPAGMGGYFESMCDTDLVSATSASKSDVRAVAHRHSGPSMLSLLTIPQLTRTSKKG